VELDHDHRLWVRDDVPGKSRIDSPNAPHR
jgi:hypothetical protein